jgi:primosomal protein N' (replication factor Y) (superfamily II helicase)
MLVEIIFPNISDKAYTYVVPKDLESDIQIGMRIFAPVGNKNSIGFIVGIKENSDRKDLKSISDIIDSEPIFSKDLWELTKWVSLYYYSNWGIALRTCFPRESRVKSKKMVKINFGIDLKKALAKISVKTKQRMIVLQEIFSHDEIQIDKLAKLTGIKSINAIINEFQRLGIVVTSSKLLGARIKYEKVIILSDDLKDRNYFKSTLDDLEKKSQKQFEFLLYMYSQSAFLEKPQRYKDLLKLKKISPAAIKSLIEKKVVIIEERESIRIAATNYSEKTAEIVLNKHQEKVVSEIIQDLDKREYSPFLLHGITGSGKTQVYIESIKYALSLGKDAIVLVPEISLTPQLVHRFQRYFGGLVTVIHSKMSAGERFDSWRLIIEGKYKIVIGARSAIFAPLKNLGIIVVDEEHEPSYKQFDMSPRYNARDTAIMRGIFSKSVVVLGSATPSIESYYNAQNGKYKLVELPERIDDAKLPEIEIVGMKKEKRMRRWQGSLSNIMQEKIKDRISKKEGIILLQNHRGFSTYAKCLNCGYVETCENCNVTMTFHKSKNHLRCHYCGFIKEAKDTCPKCYGKEMEFGGVGTQKVEEEITNLFPDAKLLRMDLDTTARKGAHTNILKEFGEGKSDILLGTQMVAKGLDFARVTLVGVILADTGMHLPDFRANERTFQLLTQVAGRAGRSNLKGQVLIQTYIPEHYCFQYILAQDYKDFYNFELNERKSLLYPPFGRIILIEFKGEVESEVISFANSFFSLLNKSYQYKIKKTGDFCKFLGPAPAVISKIKNNYRIHLIIKSDRNVDPNLNLTRSILNYALEHFNNIIKSKRVSFFIDVDPQGLL